MHHVLFISSIYYLLLLVFIKILIKLTQYLTKIEMNHQYNFTGGIRISNPFRSIKKKIEYSIKF